VIAVILAAGVSSRLRPLTDSIPKALLAVGNKPLLQRTLETLRTIPVERCVVVCGYHRDAIAEFFRSFPGPVPVTLIDNPLFGSTGNNYSLWCARAEVAGHAMILLDSDILFDPRILVRLLASPHSDALVIKAGAHLGREEVKVETDGDGCIRKIGKEIEPARASGESIGIEKFSQGATADLFSILEQRKEASFQVLIDRGHRLFAVPSTPFACIEIDTRDDLAEAEEMAKSFS